MYPENSSLEYSSSKFSLKEILAFDNPKYASYQKILKDLESANAGSGQIYFWPTTNPSFSDIEMRELNASDDPECKKIKELMKSRLEKNIVIDLGSGSNSLYYRLLEQKIDFQAYIGVDVERYDESGKYSLKEDRTIDPETGEVIDEVQSQKKPGFHEVREDALLFTARLNSNSCCFSVFGPTVSGYPYNKLNEEMIRALKPGGIIFGGGAGVHHRFGLLAVDYPNQIKKLGYIAGFEGLHIFEKI